MKYSFIIPVYNAEDVVGRCIESVLQQTFTDFEVILVDDGSTDSSGNVCDKYAANDTRIIVVHKPNEGVSSARNFALNGVRGQYIVFVDSDDYIEPDYLETLEEKPTDLKILGYKIEDETGNIKKIHQYENYYIKDLNKDRLIEIFDEGDLNYIWGKCFRADIIKEYNIKFDMNVSLAEDTLFVLEYIKHIKEIKYYPNIVYHYIKYDTQTLTKIDFNSDITINKYEKVNDKIYLTLIDLVGKDAEMVIENRMGQLYKEMLSMINNGQKCSFMFVHNLFANKWFKKVLSHVDQYFFDESNKYRMILKTRSAILFWLFLKYKNK